MFKYRFALVLSFILIGTAHYAYSSDPNEWDSVSDQQIESCLSSDTFQNMLFFYSHEHHNWKLRIIFNPNYEKIELSNRQPSMFQFYYGVFSQDLIPQNLQSHLKELIENQLKSSKGGYWGISSTINGILAIDYFADARAVYGTGRSEPEPQKDVSKKTGEAREELTHFDQEIYDLLKNEGFKKLSVNYSWQGNSYLVHFVYNPTRELLLCSELSNPVRWPFAVTIDASSYPSSLAKHIKSIIPENLLKDSESVIDISDWSSHYCITPPSVYKNLHPISTLTKIENYETDNEIKKLSKSKELSKKSLYYELGNNFYCVFLIHNPEQLNLKSTLSFDTWENGQLTHTATWNSKIGIFVDKKAPQELIDHITELYELSWWDKYWDLSVHNGDKISISYLKNSWNYTYTPSSWYALMVNAQP